MPADPQWRLSGGAGNSDPNASLGGVMSSTQIGSGDNLLFDDVTGQQTTDGHTDYRGVYVYNNGDQTLDGATVWIHDEASALADIEIAQADEAIGVTMETIANETTAPAGPVFQEAPNKAGGINVGNIPAGSRKGIWIKRIVAPGTGSGAARSFTLRVEGDTL